MMSMKFGVVLLSPFEKPTNRPWNTKKDNIFEDLEVFQGLFDGFLFRGPKYTPTFLPTPLSKF